MSILGLVRDRIRHHLFLRSATYALLWAGLEIVPYYVTREAVTADAGREVTPGLEPVVADFLSPADIDRISGHPESPGLAAEKARLLADGCRCFGLKHHEEIVAYMWCDFQRCETGLADFPLQQDEVYLFRAVTFSSYRGLNLAPFLRSQLYRRLHGMGRTRIFSLTEALNYPAVRFKEKLGARQIKLGLYVRLFRKYHWNFTLREYPA